MPQFQKGNKLGRGGKRPGAGRKGKNYEAIREALCQIGYEFLRNEIGPALEAYKQLVHGRPVKHFNQQTGEMIYTDNEVDPATVRHFIDRFLPAAAKLDLDLTSGGKRIFMFELPEESNGGNGEPSNENQDQARPGGFAFGVDGD